MGHKANDFTLSGCSFVGITDYHPEASGFALLLIPFQGNLKMSPPKGVNNIAKGNALVKGTQKSSNPERVEQLGSNSLQCSFPPSCVQQKMWDMVSPYGGNERGVIRLRQF